MPQLTSNSPPARDLAAGFAPEAQTEMPVWAHYAITLALVAVAALLAFVASQFVPAPGLTLIFVLPVVIAGAMFGWRPSLAAIAAGMLTFDFVFTQPYWSLRIDDPSEIWAAGLLLVTAVIVSAVTWQSRQRAYDARRGVERADALRLLARTIMEGRAAEVAPAAAAALSRIFAAPAVILAAGDGKLVVSGQAGGATLSPRETEAAQAALTTRSHIRAETYPHEESRFDFWPAGTATRFEHVIGVAFGRSAEGRPADPDRFVEIVAAYLAVVPGGAGP